MATNCAIIFNSPIKIPISAMKNVKNNAFLGSLFKPDSLAKNLGVILSKDMAWSILGPPKIPPKAEDKVAPQTPQRTKNGTAPNSIRTLLLVLRNWLSIL